MSKMQKKKKKKKSQSHVPGYHYCTQLFLGCYVKLSIPGVSQVRPVNERPDQRLWAYAGPAPHHSKANKPRSI